MHISSTVPAVAVQCCCCCVCVLALQFCHAFVGYLEEEAVKTYTQALQVRRLSASGPYLNMRSGLIGWIVLNFSD
jgi:hypothetical protein